jgi:hypothetical protein
MAAKTRSQAGQARTLRRKGTDEFGEVGTAVVFTKRAEGKRAACADNAT